MRAWSHRSHPSTFVAARNQTVEIPDYFEVALDNGVKPREISEIITHLAFYTGCGNAVPAAEVGKRVFAARTIGADQLPPASPALLPLDQDAERKRATNGWPNAFTALPVAKEVFEKRGQR